jgi:hypothetical protein
MYKNIVIRPGGEGRKDGEGTSFGNIVVVSSEAAMVCMICSGLVVAAVWSVKRPGSSMKRGGQQGSRL